MNDGSTSRSAAPPSGADVIGRFAEALFTAERQRRPIPPLTDSCPGLSVRDAYLIQQKNVERRVAAGERVRGHKIGLTAKAMQDLFGVREPDYGHLLDTMFLDERQPLDLSSLIDPQIEVEPAFVLSRRLSGPDLTIADVIAATEYICVCFEVIDSRIIDWRVKLQDTVADNGSSARVILGAAKVSPAGLDLANLHTELEVDGVVVETGNTGAILGHPANGVAWLARKIAEFGLLTLEPGDVVLPGTCTRSYRIGGHKRVDGRIEGLGSVSVALAGAPAIANIRRS
jgi:2-keto-4-pentenoate hydratase